MVKAEGKSHREIGNERCRVIFQLTRGHHHSRGRDQKGPSQKHERPRGKMLGRDQSEPVKSDPNAHQQKLVVGFVPVVKKPDRGCSGKDETGQNGAKGQLHRRRDERPTVALCFAPDEKYIQREHNGEGAEPKCSEAAGGNMAHHLRSYLRPMTLAHPNRGGQPECDQAADEGGGGGNGAINSSSLHQGSNDPQMLFSALAFVHSVYFVIQSLKSGKDNLKPILAAGKADAPRSRLFSRLDRVSPYHRTAASDGGRYSGDGTFIRKITIIMSPIKSFAMTPVRPPRKVPQPARPAFMISFPPISSPAIAPITGPTKSPNNPKTSPMSAPATPPIRPHFVAPNRFAPT